ncbi:hypothetical protein ACQXYD_10440, partial [Corynebacterium diphtheriae]
MRNRIPNTNHQAPSFPKTLINFSYGSSPLVRAGVQFSKTLIDFKGYGPAPICRWGSVLKNPDRLRNHRFKGGNRAGVQFSKTLIDFRWRDDLAEYSWGSVLK